MSLNTAGRGAHSAAEPKDRGSASHPGGPDDTLCSASAYEPVNEGLGDNRATQAAFYVEELGSMKLLALHWTPSLGPST